MIINLRCAQPCGQITALDECLVKSEILEGRLQAVPTAIDAFKSEVLRLLNAQRGTTLRRISFLDTAAQQQSDDLRNVPNLSHVNPIDRSGAADRINAAYTGQVPPLPLPTGTGEIIASGQTTPQQVVNAWLASPAHRVILQDPRLTEVGIGVAGNFFANEPFRLVWTVDFAQPSVRTPDRFEVQGSGGGTLINPDKEFEALRSLLRKAEEAFCAGRLGSFNNLIPDLEGSAPGSFNAHFGAFIDLWIQLGLGDFELSNDLANCLEAVLNNLGFYFGTSSSYTSPLRFFGGS